MRSPRASSVESWRVGLLLFSPDPVCAMSLRRLALGACVPSLLDFSPCLILVAFASRFQGCLRDSENRATPRYDHSSRVRLPLSSGRSTEASFVFQGEHAQHRLGTPPDLAKVHIWWAVSGQGWHLSRIQGRSSSRFAVACGRRRASGILPGGPWMRCKPMTASKPVTRCPPEEVVVSGPEDPMVFQAPNCNQCGLERDEWLAYYEAWIQRIDVALAAYGTTSLMGDSRGRFQAPTWLVEGLIQVEDIRWSKPSPPVRLKRSGTSRAAS